MISALRPGQTYSLIQSFHQDTGSEGEVSIILPYEQETFNLAIWVKKDGEVVVYEKFEDEFQTGTEVSLEIYPDWYTPPEPEINETLNETSEVIIENESEVMEEIPAEEESAETKPTGAAIFGDEGILSKKTAYYALGILVLLGGFVFTKTMRKKFASSKEIKVKKLSEIQADKKEKIKDKMEIIEDAERKIKEAQEEIKKIKDDDALKKREEKIKAAKQKIIEDEKELMRLRKGEE